MSFLAELAEALLAAIAPQQKFNGRIVDAIGLAVPNASVRALTTGMPSGQEIAQATTGEDGRFGLSGTYPARFRIEVVPAPGRSPAKRVLWFDRAPAEALGDIVLGSSPQLTAAVGDGGVNRPVDVRRVQDALHRIGRLTDAEVAAEAVNLAAAPPWPVGPRTMAALATHLQSLFGRRLPTTCVDPANVTGVAFAQWPPFAITAIALDKAVGLLPGGNGAAMNAAASFATVQSRLQQLGFLMRAQSVAERVDPASAGAVNVATKPQTCEAILRFDRAVVGGSLRAIVPNTANERCLNDPVLVGRQPLRVSASVGAAAVNRAADVRAVQDRLLDLGLLTAADHAAERPALIAAAAASDHIDDAALLQTIAALRSFRLGRLGEVGDATAVPGRIEPVDPSLLWLERPQAVEIIETISLGVPRAGGVDRPRDIRLVQDRLLLLGFLTPADYATELADPFDNQPMELDRLDNTLRALANLGAQRAPLALSAAVGADAANQRSDVRAVQDRLLGLRFLAAADHAREAVDIAAAGPVDPTTLVASFAAISALRRAVFNLPAPAAGAPWTAWPRIEPDDETHRLLIDPLLFGRTPLRLDAAVGERCANRPADVRAVQDRLLTMRLLAAPDHAAEAVDAAAHAPIADTALTRTLAAIRRLRVSLMGEVEPVRTRVDVRSEALVVLDDRMGRPYVDLQLANSVGLNGANVPDDVHAVQRRLLDLGVLAVDDHEAESAAPLAAGASGLQNAQIQQTLAALDGWRLLMLGDAAPGTELGAFSEALATLTWPRIPRECKMALGNSVGRGGRNAVVDVRTVQDRLFELGLMPAIDYFRDRIPWFAGGFIGEALLGTTIAAINMAQRTIAGLALSLPDGSISAGQRVHRVLERPAYGTLTLPNPNCALASAGPARPVFADADLMKVCTAIELGEGGVSSGEIPAILRNASSTPTSWGASQVIGATAIGTLVAHPTFAAFYGLDSATCAALNARATAAVNQFHAIAQLVVNAMTEAALRAQVAAYLAANAQAVRTATGLGPRDIEGMFRANQLQRHLAGAADHAAVTALYDAHAQPDAAANLAWLAIPLDQAFTYHDNLLFIGEHQQGFATRSLLTSVWGQSLRNALTDDTGYKLGRYVVRDNWNATAGLGLTTAQRASLTAYLHNRGGNPATLATTMNVVEAYAYVVSFNQIYTQLP